MKKASSFSASSASCSLARLSGFTLIELLVVITILGILMSLGVSGAGAVRSQARTAQARNDCAGLSTAIRSFYADYSRYPISLNKKDDAPYEAVADSSGNSEVIGALLATDATLNPRGVVYYENKGAKLGSSGNPTGGLWKGAAFDPWGFTYGICVDGDYDGTLKYSGQTLKYYSSAPGDTPDDRWTPISGGAGVFSLGKDQCAGSSKQPAPGILSWY
jgi:prepilin-type N-terminal cleavage/methylation domain-containing protein